MTLFVVIITILKDVFCF